MIRGAVILAAVVALTAPAAAAASSKPAVATGAASNIAPDSALVAGKIDPNDAETTWFVQYGTTTLYGAQTAPVAAGAGTAPKNVTALLTGLSPATRYHYRFIAQNKHGITRGADRTFKTLKQPLGVTLTAAPNPIAPGAGTQLTGQLTGTNNANRDVVLQADDWPYGAFVSIGNPIVTDSAGNFSFAVLSVAVNTQFRVVMAQRPEVVSPVVVVGAAMAVRTDTKRVRTFRHSVKVRFSGSITPPPANHSVTIQKLRDGVWTQIATIRSVTDNGIRAFFRKKIRIGKTGQFRVVAQDLDGKYAAAAGRAIRIKAPR